MIKKMPTPVQKRLYKKIKKRYTGAGSSEWKNITKHSIMSDNKTKDEWKERELGALWRVDGNNQSFYSGRDRR